MHTPCDPAAPSSRPEIDAQVARILRSKPFAASERLQAFLRFVVTETVEGRGADLKEYTIGARVYDRGPDFDPKSDSIVRAEARRLRSRLRAYYEGAGTDDTVEIALPSGRYVPVFLPRSSPTDSADRSQESGALECVQDDSSLTPPHRSRVARVALAFTLLILSVLALVWTVRPQTERAQAVLLVVQSGPNVEALVTSMVEATLESELARSRHVSPIPRIRVEDALALLKAPSDTPLTPEVARAVAARDAGVEAIVVTTVAQLPSGYTVHAAIEDAGSGRALGTVQEPLTDSSGVQHTARKLAASIRIVLGEATLARRELLEAAASRSHRAVRFFSRAAVLISRRDWVGAEPLLREALGEDPQFGSAHIYLAWVLSNLGKPREDVMSEVAAAEATAASATERERLFIRASALSLKGETAKAIPVYEALLLIEPNHYWALNNLAQITTNLDPQRAPHYLRRFADRRPLDFATNFGAAEILTLRYHDAASARPYLRRAAQSAGPDDPVFMLDWLRAYGPWVNGDLRPFRRVAVDVRALPPPHSRQSQRAITAALMLLATGRATDAQAMLQWMSDPVVTNRWSAIAAATLGDEGGLRAYAKNLIGTRPNPLSAIVLSWAGYTDEARVMSIERNWARIPAVKPNERDGLWRVADAERLSSAGQHTEALRLLEQSLEVLRDSAYPEYFIAVSSLADDAIRNGDPYRARAILENAAVRRAAAYGQNTIFWIGCVSRLASLERHLGNINAAYRVERDLKLLLEEAEPGFDPMAMGRHKPPSARIWPY